MLNRPYAFLQWIQTATIPEKYILMSEPDHLWLKPMPNVMRGERCGSGPFCPIYLYYSWGQRGARQGMELGLTLRGRADAAWHSMTQRGLQLHAACWLLKGCHHKIPSSSCKGLSRKCMTMHDKNA